jgi:hypothetical protein
MRFIALSQCVVDHGVICVTHVRAFQGEMNDGRGRLPDERSGQTG